MNFRIIAKTLSVIAFLVGMAIGACALFAVYDAGLPGAGPREESAVSALGISTLVSAGMSIILYLVGMRTPNEILRREAMVVVGISWFQATLLGAVPYALCDPGLDWFGAIFESASGFTTTGSTVMSNIESFPRAILLWRSVSQWIGGVGILVVFVAILSFLGVGCRSLMQQESSLNISDAGAARIRDVASTILKVYISLTLVCALGDWLLGMTPYDALSHAMTTLSTGGFSPKNTSIAHYNSIAIETWTTLFMFLASVSFLLYIFAVNRRWDRLKAEEEAKFYLLLLIGAWIVISFDLVLMRDISWGEALRITFFNVVSISTTTGYANYDYDSWPLFSKLVLLMLMMIGGCAGSTAGGVKMNRVILFFRIAYRELALSFRPNQIFQIKLNGTRPDENVFVTTSFFIAMAFILSGIFTLVVSVLEPELNLVSASGCVFATLFNIGPSFSLVGPTDHFGILQPVTLMLLSFLMILGRLEFFAVLVLLVPALWRKY